MQRKSQQHLKPHELKSTGRNIKLDVDCRDEIENPQQYRKTNTAPRTPGRVEYKSLKAPAGGKSVKNDKSTQPENSSEARVHNEL